MKSLLSTNRAVKWYQNMLEHLHSFLSPFLSIPYAFHLPGYISLPYFLASFTQTLAQPSQKMILKQGLFLTKSSQALETKACFFRDPAVISMPHLLRRL